MHQMFADTLGETILIKRQHLNQEIAGLGRVDDILNAETTRGIPGFGIQGHFL